MGQHNKRPTSQDSRMLHPQLRNQESKRRANSLGRLCAGLPTPVVRGSPDPGCARVSRPRLCAGLPTPVVRGSPDPALVPTEGLPHGHVHRRCGRPGDLRSNVPTRSETCADQSILRNRWLVPKPLTSINSQPRRRAPSGGKHGWASQPWHPSVTRSRPPRLSPGTPAPRSGLINAHSARYST